GGTLRKGETITVAGRPAIAVHDAESVLYVATTGTPYPLRVADSGSPDSALDFLDYDSPVTVTPPKDSLPVPRTWSWLARKGGRGWRACSHGSGLQSRTSQGGQPPACAG
ncbi:MAG TPA: hypothetical protein VGR06_34705, partial [Actinophytocola sp.]|uniref:hypothetical protein n=1 Tax=Actinophytocola sp. TaxID=1872138 RepID=UPI002E034627|nr:hypothetical protein [Actinophytocola sp.]